MINKEGIIHNKIRIRFTLLSCALKDVKVTECCQISEVCSKNMIMLLRSKRFHKILRETTYLSCEIGYT